jgi:hypothetical protein
MYYVPAIFSLWNRINGIQRKFGSQQVFQRLFLYFTLQLLGALFRPLSQFLDLVPHGRDGLILLHHLELEPFFCLSPGLGPHRRQFLLNALSIVSALARAWRHPALYAF